MANVDCKDTKNMVICMLLTMVLVFSCASTKKDVFVEKTVEKIHSGNNASTTKSVEKIGKMYTFPGTADGVFMRHKITEYTSRSGNTFAVLESAHGLSVVTVTIAAKFSFSADNNNNNIVYYLGEMDRIVNIWQTDLDNDGYDEWFIFTRSVSSGSYGEVFGYVSDNDTALLGVHIPELTEKEQMGYSYMGHDTFWVSSSQDAIVREFPLYRDNDSNANPTGGRVKIWYSLIRKGAEFVLTPVNIDHVSQ